MGEESLIVRRDLSECCIETIGLYEGSENEGDVLDCQWCSKSVIYRDGAWKLKREPSANAASGEAQAVR